MNLEGLLRLGTVPVIFVVSGWVAVEHGIWHGFLFFMALIFGYGLILLFLQHHLEYLAYKGIKPHPI